MTVTEPGVRAIDPAAIEAGRALYVIGDVRDCLAATPDGSIDLVMTSPPFLALRSYLPADHPDKWREIGAEPDPASFIDTLLALTAEFRRVLAPHGSIVVELGDTYSGSGGAGGDYNPDGLRDGQNKFDGSNSRRGRVVDHDSGRRTPGDGWPLAKSMVGIPHLYHLSLAYGRNLLTGQPSPAGQWRIRNVVAWCRPNPPVGALGDKFRPATSYLTIATIASDRFFDLDAVRTPGENAATRRVGAKSDASHLTPRERGDVRPGEHHAGAPPLDYWVIPTQPYSGAHYAVYPPALLERPLKSMLPKQVCRVCGEPSRRITETEGFGERVHAKAGEGRDDRNDWNATRPTTTTTTTVGWSDCGHDDWRPGIVLDPFAGSGTTLAVATGLGHAALGFDLDERNANLALDRIGPLLTDTRHLSETP